MQRTEMKHALRCSLFLILTAALGLAQQNKPSPVNGTWDLNAGGASFRIVFVEDQGDVRGTVTLPSGESVEIEYGLVIANELEFTTVEQGVEYEWTAKVSKNSIKGGRVNLDTEAEVKFTAKRAKR